jgi:hypothetical protein
MITCVRPYSQPGKLSMENNGRFAPQNGRGRENLVLMWQVRAAAVDQIDARQMVRLGNFLGPQMLFDGYWVIKCHPLPSHHCRRSCTDGPKRARFQ